MVLRGQCMCVLESTSAAPQLVLQDGSLPAHTMGRCAHQLQCSHKLGQSHRERAGVPKILSNDAGA